MSVCYIVGAGDIVPIEVDADVVIAADAGFRYLEKKGIEPNLILGDFDSLGYTPQNGNVLSFPCEKDETDMELAIRNGMDMGCDTFIINGGGGGRLDHTIANIQLLVFLAQNGCHGMLLTDSGVLTAIHNQMLCLPHGSRGMLSVFALAGVANGVSEHGMKYLLDNATLLPTSTLGVSNQILEDNAAISVEDGSLVILLPTGIDLESLHFVNM